MTTAIILLAAVCLATLVTDLLTQSQSQSQSEVVPVPVKVRERL